MDVIEGSGNVGNVRWLEVVRNEFGHTRNEPGDWGGGEFDGIRSEVDFRRAMAIEGALFQLPATAVTKGAWPPAAAHRMRGWVFDRGRLIWSSLRGLGAALATWRASRVLMR